MENVTKAAVIGYRVAVCGARKGYAPEPTARVYATSKAARRAVDRYDMKYGATAYHVVTVTE